MTIGCCAVDAMFKCVSKRSRSRADAALTVGYSESLSEVACVLMCAANSVYSNEKDKKKKYTILLSMVRSHCAIRTQTYTQVEWPKNITLAA